MQMWEASMLLRVRRFITGIHKLAYGESWQFDYEEFVGWDLNRQGRSRSISVQAKHEPTAPPVILNQHWENGRLVAN